MNTFLNIGGVQVETSSDGGHPPEFFAKRIVDRLMVISDVAPQPIRDQALAFRERMYEIVLAELLRAIASDRTYRKG